LYRIMRITTFLLIVCCVHLHATVLSQTVTMQGKSLSLKQVFSEIEAQTGYVVVYNAQALDKRMLAVSARKKPLLAFLDEVLVPGGLDFEIKNKSIVIVPRDDRNHSTESVRPVEFRFQQQAYAGTLVDESGQPVPGAT